MTENYFDELKDALHQGADDKDHPFRYFCLATVGVENMVRQRTIVLRKVSPELELTFFTDYRSKKVMHIHENHKVSLLFYDASKLLQVRIDGLARIDKNEQEIQAYWKEIEGSRRKDYTTTSAPGSELKNPETLDYLSGDHYFCAVHVIPKRIEYLKLSSPDHIRVRFTREDGHWEGRHLVP